MHLYRRLWNEDCRHLDSARANESISVFEKMRSESSDIPPSPNSTFRFHFNSTPLGTQPPQSGAFGYQPPGNQSPGGLDFSSSYPNSPTFALGGRMPSLIKPSEQPGRRSNSRGRKARKMKSQ